LAQRAAGKRLVGTFYQVSDVPLYTVGGQHLISQALALCGAQNVFGSLDLPAPDSRHRARTRRAAGSDRGGHRRAAVPPWLDEWRRWPELPAVRADKLFVVDANLLHSLGTALCRGRRTMCDVDRACSCAMNLVEIGTRL
jgi:iron complex transport system substrate-binding protein